MTWIGAALNFQLSKSDGVVHLLLGELYASTHVFTFYIMMTRNLTQCWLLKSLAFTILALLLYILCIETRYAYRETPVNGRISRNLVVANEEVLKYTLDTFNNNGRKLWVQPLVQTETTCITTG